MVTFLEYCNVDLLEVIEIRVSSLLDTFGKFLPRITWTNEQKQRYQINAKAKYILICALLLEENEKVHALLSAKDIWKTLALAHE